MKIISTQPTNAHKINLLSEFRRNSKNTFLRKTFQRLKEFTEFQNDKHFSNFTNTQNIRFTMKKHQNSKSKMRKIFYSIVHNIEQISYHSIDHISDNLNMKPKV